MTITTRRTKRTTTTIIRKHTGKYFRIMIHCLQHDAFPMGSLRWTNLRATDRHAILAEAGKPQLERPQWNGPTAPGAMLPRTPHSSVVMSNSTKWASTNGREGIPVAQSQLWARTLARDNQSHSGKIIQGGLKRSRGEWQFVATHIHLNPILAVSISYTNGITTCS